MPELLKVLVLSLQYLKLQRSLSFANPFRLKKSRLDFLPHTVRHHAFQTHRFHLYCRNGFSLHAKSCNYDAFLPQIEERYQQYVQVPLVPQ